MIDVYYTNEMARYYPLLDIKPYPLLNDVGISDFGNYSKCPASNNILSKLFVVKSPIDVEYELLDDDNIFGVPTAPDYVRELVDAPVEKTKNNNYLAQIAVIDMLMQSKESLDVSILPPFLHDNVFKNHKFLTAEFDISRWFRPIHPALMLRDKKPLRISRGQVLCYIMFNTDEKINLIHYNLTEKIESLAKDCLMVTIYTPKKNLKYRYDLFEEKKYNSEILDEIKENLS